jgi:hypothetical protein
LGGSRRLRNECLRLLWRRVQTVGRPTQQFSAKMGVIGYKETVRRTGNLREIDGMQLINMLGTHRYDIQSLYLSQFLIRWIKYDYFYNSNFC